MADWIPFLIIGVICIIIGFLIASLIHNLRREDPEDPPEESTPAPGYEEVLRLWRHKKDGKLLPEVKGDSIASAESVNVDQHADISLALVDLYHWLESSPFATPQVTSPSPANPTVEATPPDLVEAVELGDVVPLEDHPVEPPQTLPRPSLNPLKPFIKAARRGSEPAAQEEQKTMAAEIDEILQRMLMNTAYKNREIRLIEFPVSGMMILIDQKQYQGLDAVPEGEIKEMIRAAVAEWEALKLNDGR